VVIVTGMLVMFLTFLLLAISMVIDDSRWRLARVESGSVSHCCGWMSLVVLLWALERTRPVLVWVVQHLMPSV